MGKFDDMEPGVQSYALVTVAAYLEDNDYSSLGEAAEDLGCSWQAVWGDVLTEPNVLDCDPPDPARFDVKNIPPRELVFLVEMVEGGPLAQWPARIPIPGPGQCVGDDDCGWIDFTIATVADVETFVAAKHDWKEVPDWYTPQLLVRLKFFLLAAANSKTEPDKNFLATAGQVPSH